MFRVMMDQETHTGLDSLKGELGLTIDYICRNVYGTFGLEALQNDLRYRELPRLKGLIKDLESQYGSLDGNEKDWLRGCEELYKELELFSGEDVATAMKGMGADELDHYHVRTLNRFLDRIRPLINDGAISEVTGEPVYLKDIVSRYAHRDVDITFRGNVTIVEPRGLNIVDAEGKPLNPPSRKLLVMDLEGTLVYSSETSLPKHDFGFEMGGTRYCIRKRPFLEFFVDESSKFYDLMVWTNSDKRYAKAVVDGIGIGKKIIDLKTDKDSTIRSAYADDVNLPTNFYRLKNLKKLKRPLSEVLLVDDDPLNFRKNYGNGIQIRTWKGEDDDKELLKLLKFITELKDLGDVRIIEKRGWSDSPLNAV